jgi:hypothetical protein
VSDNLAQEICGKHAKVQAVQSRFADKVKDVKQVRCFVRGEVVLLVAEKVDFEVLA